MRRVIPADNAARRQFEHLLSAVDLGAPTGENNTAKDENRCRE
jgi:hypothetical protein